MMSFSVIISIYNGEKPLAFKLCLDSLLLQSLKPSEIIIVKDGYLKDSLENAIIDFRSNLDEKIKLKLIQLEVASGGAWKSRRVGVCNAEFDLIAIVDSDDINHRNRFKNQISVFRQYPKIDVVGSNISEFIIDPSLIESNRIVPENHIDIQKYAKTKNPINHNTLMYKRDIVLLSGNYQENYGFADYGLVVRLLLNGAQFYNIQENLVNMRIGNDMIGRRHGINYFKQEIKHFNMMRSLTYISYVEFLKIIILRFFLRILPKSILSYLYKKYSRV